MPNQLVELWRQHFPDDQRSDDAITLGIGGQFPDLLNRYPDAASDYGRLQLPVKSVTEDAAYAAGTPFTMAGKVAAGGVADAAHDVVNPSDMNLRNLSAAVSDAPEAPLPIEQELAGESGTIPAVERGALGATRMLATMAPAMVANMATGGALTPAMPALLGGSMAADTYTQTGDAKAAAKSAALGAVFPVAGAIGEHIGVKIAADLIKSGTIGDASAKAIAAATENAAFQAFGHALNADDYAKDPDKFWDKFIETTVSLAGPALLKVPGIVKKNVESEAARIIRDPSTQRTLKQRLIDSLLPQKEGDETAGADETPAPPAEPPPAAPPAPAPPTNVVANPEATYGPTDDQASLVESVVNMERINPDMPGLSEQRGIIASNPVMRDYYEAKKQEQAEPTSPPPEPTPNSQPTPPQAELATAPNNPAPVVESKPISQPEVEAKQAAAPATSVSSETPPEPALPTLPPAIGAALEAGKATLPKPEIASEIDQLETKKDFGGLSKAEKIRLQLLKAKAASSALVSDDDRPVAKQVEAARAETNPAPTDAQKQAGNYAKGQVSIDGMDISIENPKGGTRSGEADGKPWEVSMPADYGYIKGTTGKDGDHVDAFIGPNPDGFKNVWVIDQKKPDGSFDEHKSFIGFNSAAEALDTYRKSFSDGKADSRIHGMVEMTRDEFKQWVAKGKFKEPLSKVVPPADDAVRATFNAPAEAVIGQAENAKAAVRQGVTVGAGKGQSAAVFAESEDPKVLFDDANGAYIPKFDEKGQRVYKTDKAGNQVAVSQKDRTQSSKLIVMQHPSGDVLVCTATVANNKRMVADYRKVSAGKKQINTPFEELVKEGWRPLAAIKTAEPTKGYVARLTPDEWAKTKTELNEQRLATERGAEAVGAKIDEGSDFGRGEKPTPPDLGEPTGDERSGDVHRPVVKGDRAYAPTDELDAAANVAADAAEDAAEDAAMAKPDAQRVFTIGHAKAIVDAISELDAEDLADPVKGVQTLARALREAGDDAVEAFKAMVRAITDSEKCPAVEALDAARQKIYDHKASGSASAAELEESVREGGSESSHEGLGDSERGRRGTPAGEGQSREGVGAGEKENRQGLVTRHRDLDKGGKVNSNEKDAYIPEQLPPEAQRAGGGGSERAATDVLRAVHQAASDAGAKQPATRTERAELNRRLKPQEEAALKTWAKANGLLMNGAEFERKWEASKKAAGDDSGGAEHDVYSENGVYHKANNGLMHGNWLEYFHRIELHNQLFPEAPVKFEGLVERYGKLQPVISQKEVMAVRGAVKSEVAPDMARMGFKNTSGDNYYNPRTGIIVEDLHDQNAVITQSGHVRIFDPIIYIAKPEMFTKGGPLFGQQPPLTRARAEQVIKSALAPAADVQAKLKAGIENLRSMGIEMNLIRQVVGGMVKELGKYEEWKGNKDQLSRAITLSMDDARNPSVENFVTLLHEAAHAVFARETPEDQARLLQAISQTADEALGIKDYTKALDATGRPMEAGERSEERLAEAAARNLANSGFDPQEARSIIQSIFRAVKDLYHGSIMGLQKMLGLQLSQERALAYFQNRLEMVMAGKPPRNFLSWMGGPRVAFPDWNERVLNLSRNRDLNFVTDPLAEISKDVNSTANAEHKVAAENTVGDTLKAMYREWSVQGHNTAGLAFEDFLNSGNFAKLPEKIGDVNYYRPGETPDTKIADINKGLKGIGQSEVNPDTKLDGVTNSVKAKQGAALAHRALSNIWAAMSNRMKAAKRALDPENPNSLTSRLARSNNELHDILKEYTNADLIERQSVKRIGNLLNSLRRSITDFGGDTYKSGVLEQVIRDLDEKLDKPLMKQYETAINRLYKQISTDDVAGRSFTDMLGKVAGLDLDWNRPPKDLRDQLKFAYEKTADPLLAPMVENTPEGRALLAVTVAFAKQNNHVMGLLQLRKADAGKERVAVNEALAKAMQNHSGAIDEARSLARKLPKLARVTMRLLDDLQDAKARNRAALDELQRERTFADFHQATSPLMRQRMNQLEAVMGVVDEDFNVVDGAEVIDPQSPTHTPDQAAAVKTQLNLKADGTTTDQVVGILRRQSDWLAKHTAEEGGAIYNTIKAQNDKLSKHIIEYGVHQGIQGSLVNRLIAPITERLNMIGTPLARSAAAMIDKSQANWRSRMVGTHQISSTWEAQENRAMRALGVKRLDVFRKLVFGTVQSVIEKRQDLLAQNADNSKAVDAAVKEAMQHLQADPQLARMMAKPGAGAAIEKYIRLSADCGGFIGKNATEMKLKVRDTGEGYSIYRDLLGLSPYTVPRGISDFADSIFKQMTAWTGDKLTGDKLTADKVAADYNQDPNALRDSLKDRFTPDVWKKFVQPIINRTGRSAFYAPAERSDGLQRFAMRENVLKAFEASQDPVTFAEQLFRLEGGDSDMGVFVGDTLHTFQAHYNMLESALGDDSSNVDYGLPTPRRFLMDARKSEEFPAEWLEYLPYDKATMSRVTRMQAFQAAFGRDMGAMRQTLNGTLKEQQDLAGKWKELSNLFPDLAGKKLLSAMRAEAKKQYPETPTVALEEAARNVKTVQNSMKHFESLLSLNRDRPPELNVWANLLGSVAGLTVSGPATALTAHEVFLEQPFRKFGFSMAGWKFLAGETKDTAGVAFNSLLQAFNSQTGQDARHVDIANRIGIFDDDATIKRKDKWLAVATHSVGTDNRFLKPVAIAGQLAKNALTVGFGRAQEGRGVFPTLKPLSAFHWAAQVIQMSTFIRWAKTYESLIGSAVDHFNDHPENMRDDKFRFSAQQLDWKQGRGFDYMRESMAKFGMDIETMARDSINRRATDEKAPLIVDDHYRAIAQQALNESTLESSLTTRAPWLQTNVVGQIANPMLGWAIHKSYDAWKGFREPNGKRSMDGFKTGLLAYAAILPIGMAFALLRNKFDEDVMGKKQNVEDLTTIHDAHSAFTTVLDNASRIGTFGIAGELPNYWLNRDNARPISVDSRVFFVSTLENTQNAVLNLIHSRDMDYQTTVRPLLQSLGGNGFLQYAAILNNAMSLDNAEARVENRISVNNYLRVAGRESNLDVRTVNGMMSNASAPSPIKPLIGRMLLSALANDAQGFQDARRDAIAAAKEMGNEDPEKEVSRQFESSNPLRSVFKTPPTERQFQSMLNGMNDQGRTSVSEAMRLYQFYGEQIGATRDGFKKEKPSSMRAAGMLAAGSNNYESLLGRAKQLRGY